MQHTVSCHQNNHLLRLLFLPARPSFLEGYYYGSLQQADQAVVLRNLAFLSSVDQNEIYCIDHFGIPIYKGIPNRTVYVTQAVSTVSSLTQSSTSSPSLKSIVTLPPFFRSPNKICFDNGRLMSLSITRCRGLAPILGSKPSSTK